MSKYRITLDGKTYEMEIEAVEETCEQVRTGADLHTSWSTEKNAGKGPVVQVIDPSAERAVTNDEKTVVSPMPGTVLRLLAGAGEMIRKGQAVLVLEAMKMENEITAPRDGILTAMLVREGQTVSGGEALFEIGE